MAQVFINNLIVGSQIKLIYLIFNLKRPLEICQMQNADLKPELFVGSRDRFDINQGKPISFHFEVSTKNVKNNPVNGTLHNEALFPLNKIQL